MKILVVADKESKNLWDFYEPGKLDGIDLIISCGDLDPQYLSFLATFVTCPVLYVKGNHDDIYVKKEPEGCICIENKVYVHEGIRIAGFGGSMRYKEGINQYTQKEMLHKVNRLRPAIFRKKGIDILVTHAPARKIGDGEDPCHIGFDAYKKLLDKYSPKYYIHGHVHMSYGRQYSRLGRYKDTMIINAFETYIFEFETEKEKNWEKCKSFE